MSAIDWPEGSAGYPIAMQPGFARAFALARQTAGLQPVALGLASTMSFGSPITPTGDAMSELGAWYVRHQGIHATGAQRRRAARILRRLDRRAHARFKRLRGAS